MHLCTCVSDEGGDGEAAGMPSLFVLAHFKPDITERFPGGSGRAMLFIMNR
jgi:hypothetical protein